MTDSELQSWMERNRAHIQAFCFGAFFLVIPSCSFVFHDGPVAPPTVVAACTHSKLTPYGGESMIVRLASGPSFDLEPYDYGLRRGQCLPVGTQVERRRGDVRFRINGSRPTYWWYFVTFMEVLGALLLAWGAGGMWRLRRPLPPRSDFVETADSDQFTFVVFRTVGLRVLHAAILAGCIAGVWWVSAVLGGLQKYELILACVIVAIVSAAVGAWLLENPFRRLMATRIRLNRSEITISAPWWRRAVVRMPLQAITDFAVGDANPCAIVVVTSEASAMPLKIGLSDNADANRLADRLNHAFGVLEQPRFYRE